MIQFNSIQFIMQYCVKKLWHSLSHCFCQRPKVGHANSFFDWHFGMNTATDKGTVMKMYLCSHFATAVLSYPHSQLVLDSSGFRVYRFLFLFFPSVSQRHQNTLTQGEWLSEWWKTYAPHQSHRSIIGNCDPEIVIILMWIKKKTKTKKLVPTQTFQ